MLFAFMSLYVIKFTQPFFVFFLSRYIVQYNMHTDTYTQYCEIFKLNFYVKRISNRFQKPIKQRTKDAQKY